MNFLDDFYKNKRVLITGHTGFKGAWMCHLLLLAGANITGYALESPTSPNLFSLSELACKMRSIIGDIRDLEHLKKVFANEQPEIVIHMAAQPIVRESYKDPVYTYETNVIGTVNVLECVRLSTSVKSFINVTTDKVYRNREWCWGYRETDELNGYDPYSNSKSCSELVTESYINAFFQYAEVAVSTVRAGNVIGGGDFAPDRIIPDCYRAVENKKNILIRNPGSTRPYQHVLEPIVFYLELAKIQYFEKSYAGNYNVGPDDGDCRTTGNLVQLFCDRWKHKTGEEVCWIDQSDGGPHEAGFLKLDCSKVKTILNWTPCWNIEDAMDKIVEWYSAYLEKKDIVECTQRQIREYIGIFEKKQRQL